MSNLFGAKLRQLRKGQGLTQVELALKLGLASHSYIARLEAGQKRFPPSLDLVLRVATLFGVTLDDLLRDKTSVEAIQSTGLYDILPVTVDPIQFGKQVRTLRLQLGLTQSALAQQLNLSGQSGIAKIELGQKLPSLERLIGISDIFGIDIDKLLSTSVYNIDVK